MKDNMDDTTARHLAHLEDRNEQVQLIKDSYPHPKEFIVQEEALQVHYVSLRDWLLDAMPEDEGLVGT